MEGGRAYVTAYDFAIIQNLSRMGIKKGDNFLGTIDNPVKKLEKDIIVYKRLAYDLIAKLELEKGQTIQSVYRGKCRTNKAKVLEITNINGDVQYPHGQSIYNGKFIYNVGKTVKASYCKRIDECESGIHFFLTRKEAENYVR